jgi:hypothetical protein
MAYSQPRPRLPLKINPDYRQPKVVRLIANPDPDYRTKSIPITALNRRWYGL